jgi:hypothetical protein
MNRILNIALDARSLTTDAIAQGLRQMSEDPLMCSELAQKARIRGQQFRWKQEAADVMVLMVGILKK